MYMLEGSSKPVCKPMSGAACKALLLAFAFRRNVAANTPEHVTEVFAQNL